MTTTRKPIVTRFHLLLIGLLLAITATAYARIPADTGLPVHWGIDGRPDRIWPRDVALLVLPALGVMLAGLFAAIGRFAAPERVEPGRHVSEAVLAGLLGLFCALQFSLVLIGVGSDIDMVRIVAFGLAGLLVVLGNMLPKSRPNAYAGVRLPWTISDPANWIATHRLTGVLFMLGGAGLALVAWQWPDPSNLLQAIGAALLVPSLAGGLYSFLRSRRRPGAATSGGAR